MSEVDEGVEKVDLRSDSTTQDLLEINKKWGTSIGSTRKVPYWIKKGEMFGYIQKGWSMMSYLRNTVIPARHEDEFKQGRYKEGFENVITWGRQGTKKSNLNRQMMFAMLGDWRTVLDYMLMTKEQLYKIYHMTTNEGIRVPYVTIDDITTTIPKQLFFVGMQEFIRFQQFVATIRLRIGVVGSNTPLPENVISVLKDNVSMEVIVFPTTPTPSYMTERYCWFPHEFRACASYLRKVMVEYKTWDYRAEPYEIFHEYNERRWKITEEIVKKLQGDDAEPEQIIPQVDMKEFEKAIRICETCKCQSSRPGICVCETFIPRHRHAAVQLANEKLRSVVASVLQTLQEKASTVSAQKKKDLIDVYGAPPSVFDDVAEPDDERPPQ